MVSLKKWFAHFFWRKTIIRTLLNLEKRQYLPHYWADKGFKGTVVNQTSSSLNRGTLKITFTVPLIQFTTFQLFKDKITEIYPKRKVYFRENQKALPPFFFLFLLQWLLWFAIVATRVSNRKFQLCGHATVLEMRAIVKSTIALETLVATDIPFKKVQSSCCERV